MESYAVIQFESMVKLYKSKKLDKYPDIHLGESWKEIFNSLCRLPDTVPSSFFGATIKVICRKTEKEYYTGKMAVNIIKAFGELDIDADHGFDKVLINDHLPLEKYLDSLPPHISSNYPRMCLLSLDKEIQTHSPGFATINKVRRLIRSGKYMIYPLIPNVHTKGELLIYLQGLYETGASDNELGSIARTLVYIKEQTGLDIYD